MHLCPEEIAMALPMAAHVWHFVYVVIHKVALVFHGIRYGVPWSRLWRHDLSKFRKDEWSDYTEAFWASLQRLPLPKRFRQVVLTHALRNRHHWERWCVIQSAIFADGKSHTVFPDVVPHQMDDVSVREMVADWHAAAPSKAAFGLPHDSPRDFYELNRDQIRLHPATRQRVEELLQ